MIPDVAVVVDAEPSAIGGSEGHFADDTEILISFFGEELRVTLDVVLDSLGGFLESSSRNWCLKI